MEKHRDGENSVYYESFKKMMKFEKESSLHEKSGFVSGSRTMLRLHRGLGMYIYKNTYFCEQKCIAAL
jgi:hypothetical protein